MKTKSDKWHVTSGKRQARSAMALVITLILLSVTLVMIIALLAVARRERMSVGTSTDATTARLASDAALAAAQAQIVANLRSTNAALFSYGMLVSTNNQVTGGILPGTAAPNYVSYYDTNGNVLQGNDFNQVVTNLQFLPRAPVMVSAAEPAGRFYLDLNRNGAFEDTGDNLSNVVLSAALGSYVVGNQVTGGVLTNGVVSLVGDPQWIGQLQNPAATHGSDNKFLSRYAFIALPEGMALDLNYIHNENVGHTVMPNANSLSVSDTFMRNQGVGSWEINLAAFLADLNTNQWDSSISSGAYQYFPYQYMEPLSANAGNSFYDALSLVSWRYNYNYNSLLSANGYFYNTFNYPYNIDLYGNGPLQTTLDTNFALSVPPDYNNINIAWPGAENTNRFFAQPSDLFDPTKSYNNVPSGLNTFTNRLMNAGSTVAANGAQPTYDRYTFYRMLEQLGTDSTPSGQGKLNLNFSNAVVSYYPNGSYSNTVIVPGAETNLISWQPLDFFCAAADMLLRTYSTNWFQNGVGAPTNYLATYYGIQNFQYTYTNQSGVIVTNDPTGAGLVQTLGVPNMLKMTADGVPAISLTNIPVVINGNFVYSPSVNRLLQLAANIYDASTTNAFPSVFRPIFSSTANAYGYVNDIRIVGYEYIPNINGYWSGRNYYAINPLVNPGYYPSNAIGLPLTAATDQNVYGVPWIVGAKKGLPSFNQFAMQSDVQVTRKIQVHRTKVEAWSQANASDFTTNMMYVMSITNHIGFSFWNPYAANYVSPNASSGGISVVMRDNANMVLSNGFYNGISGGGPAGWPNPAQTNYVFGVANLTTWPGSAWDLTKVPNNRSPAQGSFIYGTFDYPFLPESAYYAGTGVFIPTVLNPPFDTSFNYAYNLPQFNLFTTNEFQAYLLDGLQIVDYVQFGGPSGIQNVNAEINDLYQGANNAPYHMWYTNFNYGYFNQILVSQKGPGTGGTLNTPTTPPNSWVTPPNMPPGTATPQGEANCFEGMFTPSGVWNYNGKTYFNTNLTMQAPYTPQRTAYIYTLWQANDPMVHYLSSDLNEANANTGFHYSDDPVNSPVPNILTNLVSPGDRYQPWGCDQQLKGIIKDDRFAFNFSMKDSLVYDADYWDFPTNKYPTVGWLGRVHRGTPWQTVFLKATNFVLYADTTQPNPAVGQVIWTNWTGNPVLYDALNMRPVEDELIFDVFTAQPNANATRGTLSVNQSHLAAWSALLSGMVVLTNASPASPSYNPNLFLPTQTNMTINPAGVDFPDSPLYLVVSNINAVRATLTNGVFQHVGEILSSPMLAEASPFLNTANTLGNDHLDYDIPDELYEWLPQQMMGLLRLDSQPRYVIYSFGQALKPAPAGTVLSSQYYGLVTNYQVVAESATRAVVTVQPSVIITNGVPQTNYSLKVESFNVLPPQ